MSKRRGFFLVVEGADASGKTTLVRRLREAYAELGWSVTPVREPGGTSLSEKARRILLDPDVSMNARSELFLYLAARAQVIDEVIVPALKRGDLVIADRFSLSTYAYQIGGRRLPARAVMTADRLARAGVSPDLTLLLTVTAKQSEERRQNRTEGLDRIEREPPGFFQAVRNEYRRCGRNQPGIVVIDSGVGADAVYKRARQLLDRRLKRRTD